MVTVLPTFIVITRSLTRSRAGIYGVFSFASRRRPRTALARPIIFYIIDRIHRRFEFSIEPVDKADWPRIFLYDV